MPFYLGWATVRQKVGTLLMVDEADVMDALSIRPAVNPRGPTTATVSSSHNKGTFTVNPPGRNETGTGAPATSRVVRRPLGTWSGRRTPDMVRFRGAD